MASIFPEDVVLKITHLLHGRKRNKVSLAFEGIMTDAISKEALVTLKVKFGSASNITLR